MALATLQEVLSIAVESNTAIPGFNIDNIEGTEAIMDAAEEEHCPVILTVGQGAIKAGQLEHLADLVKRIARESTVPVVLHLDHGISYEQTVQCLRLGFTSVMFDGSHLPLDENIAETCRIIEMARPYGAAVEAEIGCVGGSEDGSEEIAMHCTDPADAVRFEQETGVDALAIAIGNAHGNYKATPKLRFDILAQVAEDTHTPLVLHGGTGISPEDFRRCAQTGIQKINIATATFDSVEQTVRGAYDAGAIGGYYDLQGAEVQGAYKNAHRHILIFGTDGKA